MTVIEREIERVMLEAMWERAQANEGERDDAPSVTVMAKRVTTLVEAHYAGAVDRTVRLLNAVDQAASDLEGGTSSASVARALRVAYVAAAGGQ